MFQIEVEKVFSAKLIKNFKRSMMITIPIAIVREYELEDDDWVSMAFLKRVKGMKGKK